VARQYCGQLGKQDNCQVAVSLSVATATASLPVAWRIYLPESWADDAARRSRAGVPDDVVFRSKPQIALSQIAAALAEGVAPGPVLADAGYGNDSGFRAGVLELGLDYVVGVLGTTAVWPAGTEPAVPAWCGRGRRPTRLRRGGDAAPVLQVRALAEGLASDAWQTVTWREGTAETLRSRFAALRLRPAHGDARRSTPRPEEWLLIEWPDGETAPRRYWLSTLPEDSGIDALVEMAMRAWDGEAGYRALKDEIGLGHYEGRGWRGFHHHATLCVAVYAFLLRERGALLGRRETSAPTIAASAEHPQARRRAGAIL
jgi:SRSO17 transposase